MFKKTILYFSLAAAGLSGCAVVKMVTGKGEKPVLPRVLVLGVQCDNNEIGSRIAKGILENLTSKVESFDPSGYELLISSITRRKAGLPPPSADRFLAKAGADEPAPVVKFSSAAFYNELSKSQYFRTKVNLETDLDYVVIGEAKERKLPEQEEGNLITAETASVKMLELKTGDYVVTDAFKQGFFEIVASDRVGSKLAERINKYLSGVRKLERRQAKELRKKFGDE